MLVSDGRLRLDEAAPLLERALSLAKVGGLDRASELVVTRTMVRYCQAAGDMDRAAQFQETANDLAMDVWAK